MTGYVGGHGAEMLGPEWAIAAVNALLPESPPRKKFRSASTLFEDFDSVQVETRCEPAPEPAEAADDGGADEALEHQNDSVLERIDKIRKSITALCPDVFSFARFLTKAKCLEILLFWKEVPQR